MRGEAQRPVGALFWAVLLWAAGAMALAGASWGQGNLLPNGGFELDKDGDGMADAWQFFGDRGVTATWARDKGVEGKFAQKVTCTRYERISPASHVMLGQVDTFALKRGQWYRLSFWARAERINEEVVSVAIRDTSNWSECGLTESFRPTNEWKRFSFTFRATKTISRNIRLQIWFCSTGTLWLDGVELVPTEPVKTRFTEVVADIGAKNLIPNSSFECGTAGWGTIADIPGWGGNFNTLFGKVDKGQARFGRHSFKVELTPQNIPIYHFDYFPLYRVPIKAPLLANRGWFTVKPGEKYTLSAYMRADRAGLKGKLAVYQAFAGRQSKEVEFSADWQRYEFTFAPRAEQIFVALGLDLEASGENSGTLWIDGVQLERGAQASEYEPRAEVEAGIVWDEPGHLFWRAQDARVTIAAFNASEKPRTVELRATVTDFFDKEVAKPQLTLNIGPRAAARAELALGVNGNGFFRVALSARGAALVQNRPERLAVIQRYTGADSLWGMNHAYPWPHLLDLSKQIGLLWFRDWSLKWQAVEPRKGQFDFAQADFQINRVLERGINVLGLLPFPSSDWSSTAPGKPQPATTYPKSRERMAYMPRDLREFAEYVKRTVERYRGRITVWEVLNEPVYTSYALPRSKGYTVADYIRLLKVAFRAIKEANPEAFVIGGIAGAPGNLTSEFIAGGGLQYVDALNLHTYPGKRPPEWYEEALAKLKKEMAAAGQDKPIWFTEGAYYADDDLPFVPYKAWLTPLESERQAAEWLVKFDTILLAYGTEKIIYHSGTPGQLNNESLSGIFFEWDGAPRKMLAAQAAMAALLGERVWPLGRLAVGPGTRAYGFAKPARTIIVCWRERGEPALTLGAARRNVAVLDIVGNPLPAGSKIGQSPVYFVVGGELSPDEAGATVEGLLSESGQRAQRQAEGSPAQR